ncbi:hypothetical protein VB636_22965, partial [Paracoccus sp. APAP_BH8]|uniref:hypothetical protein n=1 Tax=Paracoccus sp. APAP_BH8 TaxID=3110237 RepID=UPI002FD82322
MRDKALMQRKLCEDASIACASPAYLDRYPDGIYAQTARQRLAQADRATDLALRAQVAAAQARGKLPPTGAEAGGIVALAMGKMGAGELNYSSDIDLIGLVADHDEALFGAHDMHRLGAVGGNVQVAPGL